MTNIEDNAHKRKFKDIIISQNHQGYLRRYIVDSKYSKEHKECGGMHKDIFFLYPLYWERQMLKTYKAMGNYP